MKRSKKSIYGLSCCMLASVLMACGSGAKKTDAATEEGTEAATESAAPEYTVLDNPQVDLSEFESLYSRTIG